MVDEQLATSVEEVRKRARTVVGVEAVLLLDPHPRQLAALPRQLVAEPRVLFLGLEQLLPGGEPLLMGSDPLVGHLLSPSLSGRLSGVGRWSGAQRRLNHQLRVSDGSAGEDDDVAFKGPRIDEAHRFSIAGLAEEARAGPEHDREDLQPQLVDEVVLDQHV